MFDGVSAITVMWILVLSVAVGAGFLVAAWAVWNSVDHKISVPKRIHGPDTEQGMGKQ